MFKATLQTNQTEYTSEASSILEALNGLGLDFTQVKTKGSVKITDGEKSAEKDYTLPRLRRLMMFHPLRKGLANELEMRLK